MFKKVLLLVPLFLFFLFFTLGLAEGSPPRKVVIFCLDGVDCQTLFSSKLPNFRYLVNKGSAGLLSNEGYRGADTFRGYLTLGTGNRAPYSSYAAQSYETKEEGYPFFPEDVYKLQNGKAPGKAEAVHLGLNLIEKDFEEPLYPLQVGALGTELHRRGLKTAVIGNSDLGILPEPQNVYRFGPTVVMDNKGLVDRAAIGKEILEADPYFPYGVKINNQEVFSRFKSFSKQAHVLVIEYGDTFRLNRYKDFLSEERRKIFLNEILSRADELVGKLLKQINPEKDFFILVAPSTEEEEDYGRPLSPIIIFGPGYSSGLLISATSHQEGFVSNTDFAPTVLNFLGINKSSYFLGNSIYSQKSFSTREKINFLISRAKRALFIDWVRKPMVIFFASLQVVLYFLTFLVILINRREKFRPFLTWGFLLFLSLPLSFQIWPGLVTSWDKPFLTLVLLIFFFCFLLIRIYYWSGNKDYSYLSVTFLTFCWLVYDLFTGSKQSLDSVFGYSSILGARFFGLGNEEMAILLSVFLLFLALLLERNHKFSERKSWLVLAVMAFFFLVGWPSLGADFGGTLTAFTALSFFLLSIFKTKISFKKILFIFLIGLLLVTLFVAYDLSRPPANRTHLARTFTLVEEEGISSLFLTVARKADTNWRVFRYSPWSFFFLLTFVFLIALFFRPEGWLKNFFSERPFLKSAFYSSLLAGVVGFLLNDSGIVIPALIISFFLPYLFLSLLEGADGVRV